jgi:hypothetical protein
VNIEKQIEHFDATFFHVKMSPGWHKVSTCSEQPEISKIHTGVKKSTWKRRPKNSKRKTLRTHRDGKSRR